MIICFLLCTPLSSLSQEIEILFALDTSHNSLYDTLSPYLNIRYTNFGPDDYYFPALAYCNQTCPYFGYFLHFKEKMSHDDIIQSLKQFKEQRYCLPLLQIEDKDGDTWYLAPDDGKDEHEWDFINHYLEDFYCSNEHRNVKIFTTKELRNPCFIRKHPAFIFLKAGETLVQSISIRGCKEAQIILRIYLPDTTSRTTMLVGPSYFDAYNLPNKVKGYSLYTGSFSSNELIVDFSR